MLDKLKAWVWNKGFYSDFARNLAVRLMKRFPFLIPYPQCIEVETSTACMLKCKMCEHTYWDEPDVMMSLERFKYIVDQFPKLRWIGMTGIGESFLNPDFLDMLRYVRSKGTAIELFDNFFLIDENTADTLIDIHINRFYISLDAATKETYEKIRVGSNWERVIKNLRYYIKHKNKDTTFDFHFIVNKLNIHEMCHYVGLVKELSPNSVIWFTRVLHNYPEIEDIYCEISQAEILDVEEVAKKLNMKIRWGADVPKIKPDIKNCLAWLMPFIFVTGHVIPCCACNEANKREIQKKNSIGNLFETPFKELWRGKRYQNLKNCIRNNKRPSYCTSCSVFQYDEGDKDG